MVTSNGLVSRRHLLGAAACLAASRSSALERPWLDRRVAALNWAVLETLCAMGVRPLAGAELRGYARVVAEPGLPPGVADVGFQGTPNLEALLDLAPAMIFIQSWQAALEPSLRRCAPVETLAIQTGEGDVYDRAGTATRRIGALLDCAARSGDLIERTEAILTSSRRLLTPHAARPVYLAQMIAQDTLSLFTSGSLFDGVLARLGLRNAWQGAPDLLWGGTRVDLAALTGEPDALLLLIASPGMAARETLTQSRLWQTLPCVRAGRLARLPSTWAFGALPTAGRFARLVADAVPALRAA